MNHTRTTDKMFFSSHHSGWNTVHLGAKESGICAVSVPEESLAHTILKIRAKFEYLRG